MECLDSPGFVCNRLLVPMLNEAIYALFENVAAPADIDKIMQLGEYPAATRASAASQSHDRASGHLHACLPAARASHSVMSSRMREGANHPMGPLSLCDLIGLDTILNVMEVLHREFGEDKYRPCPLLRKMIDAGQLGRKSGKGFYDYAKL